MNAVLEKLNRLLKGDLQLMELIRGSSASLIFQSAGIVLSYLFTLVLARFYGVSAVGIFTISLTVVNIFSLLSRLGLDRAAVRLVAGGLSGDGRSSRSDYFSTSLILTLISSIILSAALYLLAPVIAVKILKKPELTAYLQLISPAITGTAVVFVTANSLRGLKMIKAFSFFKDTSIHLFAMPVLLAAALISRGSTIPVIAYMAGSLSAAFGALIFCLVRFGLPFGRFRQNIRPVLSLSLPMLLSSSFGMLGRWSDIIMLSIMCSSWEVGIFSVALKVSIVMKLGIEAINSIAAPKFAEFYSKGRLKELEKTVRNATRMIFWVSFPLLAVIFLVPDFILGIFDSSFTEGRYALLMLTFGQFISSISGSVGILLQMCGKEKVFQNIVLLALTVHIVLNVVLIPKFGYTGAAFAGMLSLILNNLLCVVYIKKKLGIFTMYFPVLAPLKNDS